MTQVTARELFDAAVKAGLLMPGLVAGVEPDEVWSPNPAECIVYAPKRMASLADVECAVMDALAERCEGFQVSSNGNGWECFIHGRSLPDHMASPTTGDKFCNIRRRTTRAAALKAACEMLAKEAR